MSDPIDDEFVAPEAPGQFGADLDGANRYLDECGWPAGLRATIAPTFDKETMRFIIVDNSGSMQSDDGERIVSDHKGGRKPERCTRWLELTDAIMFHAELAERSACQTEFRLLNGCRPIILGNREDDGRGLKTLKAKLEEEPHGNTPICKHINEVVNKIVAANEGRDEYDYIPAVLCIFTDGEPSDGLLSEYLAPLVDYPVWIVVRLCTNTENIVEYWNKMDKELEIEMDILDDFVNEARGVHELNPWLTYGEPLHRIREWGIRCPDLDYLDENRLTHQQMYNVCKLLLFGSKSNELPAPADWEKFFLILGDAKHLEPKTYDPVRKRLAGWVNMRTLERLYGPGGGCSIM